MRNFFVIIIFQKTCRKMPGALSFIAYSLTDRWPRQIASVQLSLFPYQWKGRMIMPILLGSFKASEMREVLKTLGNCPTVNLCNSLLSSTLHKSEMVD